MQHIAYDHIIQPPSDSVRRAASKRLASATDVINELFSRHARLMVVRVDLWYEQPHVHIPRNNAIQDLDTLWRQIDAHPVLNNYVGWIWKLEYGMERGTHFHLMFIYKGSEHREDITFGLEIKRLWESSVAESIYSVVQGGYFHAPRTGLGFVVNLQKEMYANSALGVIHRDDLHARQGLIDAVAYLCKADGLIGHISAPREKNFGAKVKA